MTNEPFYAALRAHVRRAARVVAIAWLVLATALLASGIRLALASLIGAS